jgi:hypothetical protein
MLEDRGLNEENGSSVLMVSFQTSLAGCLCLTVLRVDVTAIIFVVACSSFNMVIREDEETVSGKG